MLLAPLCPSSLAVRSLLLLRALVLYLYSPTERLSVYEVLWALSHRKFPSIKSRKQEKTQDFCVHLGVLVGVSLEER